MTQVIIFTGSSRTNPDMIYDKQDVALQLMVRPLGAYQIASILRNNGYTVQVIDKYHWFLRHDKDSFKKIVEHHVSHDTLWIGWSNTFWEGKSIKFQKLGDAYRQEAADTIGMTEKGLTWLSNFAKSKNPNVKFIAGGSKTWRWSQEGYKFFDYYVEGYADQMILDLTNYIAGKGPKPSTNINDDNSEVLNYDKKANKFDFVNHVHKWHESDHIMKGEALPIEIARGCVFRCAYCSFPLNGKKKLDFIRDPDKLKEEFIRNYELFGVDTYVYSDDTHNDSVEKLEFLYNKVYSQLPFKIKFSTYLRLDLLAAHPYTIELLKESGLIGTFFGIESFNYETNKTVGKGAKEERIWENLWKCREIWKNQVQIHSGCIVGLPNDNEETVRAWGEKVIAVDSPIDFSMITELHIFPNYGNDPHWMNKIELNPKAYGYTFDDDGVNYTNNMGLTKIKAKAIAAELMNQQWKNKTINTSQATGWLSTARAKCVGLSLDEYAVLTNQQVLEKREEVLKKYAADMTKGI